MRSVYLDYAATAPMLSSVQAKMSDVMAGLESGYFGNPSALHTPGQRSRELLESARAEVAKLINAEPEEIIFTSGGSEANNMVLGTFRGCSLAVSAIEHPSVLNAAKAYAQNLTILPVDQFGVVNIEKNYAANSEPELTSVMLANNELGTIEPVALLRQRIRGHIHTDATQAVGKMTVNVKELGVDYLTFSAHKLGGPVGIGALYVKNGAKIHPLILGGHQELGRRAGTSNVLLAAGFAAATNEARKMLQSKKALSRVRDLRNYLADAILAQVPYSSLNTPLDNSLPNILNVSFRAAEGEAIQLYLDAKGITVSTGSACASGSLEPSHVLMATRHDAEVAHSSIRFSLGSTTTRADLDYVMAHLPPIIQRLQSMSTIPLPRAPQQESLPNIAKEEYAK